MVSLYPPPSILRLVCLVSMDRPTWFPLTVPTGLLGLSRLVFFDWPPGILSPARLASLDRPAWIPWTGPPGFPGPARLDSLDRPAWLPWTSLPGIPARLVSLDRLTW